MRPHLLAAFLATACAAVPPDEEPAPGRGGNQPCYGSTSNWRAWIDAMPGPEPAGLIVVGTVTTPTGGNRLSLTLGPTLRSDPPQQIVDLQIRREGDMATQAVVTQEVRARFPALPRYGAVIIHCNGQEVGRVSPVDTAH